MVSFITDINHALSKYASWKSVLITFLLSIFLLYCLSLIRKEFQAHTKNLLPFDLQGFLTPDDYNLQYQSYSHLSLTLYVPFFLIECVFVLVFALFLHWLWGLLLNILFLKFEFQDKRNIKLFPFVCAFADLVENVGFLLVVLTETKQRTVSWFACVAHVVKLSLLFVAVVLTFVMLLMIALWYIKNKLIRIKPKLKLT